MATSIDTQRISNITTWVERLRKLCPISAISMELVKFDLQQMEQPEIQGSEYQQGTLFGYELREYLLEKWHKKKPERLAKILAQARAPLKDAAAVNATRWTLFEHLKQFGVPVECGSGGLTRFNRTQRGLPKAHWLDAACVGRSTPEMLHMEGITPLCIKANGHGNRQMCGTDEHGFPIRHRQRQKVHHGYQTGDLVRAVVPEPLKTAGTHIGWVLARATGSFDIQTQQGRMQNISHQRCMLLYRIDGYSYTSKKR